MLDVAKESQHVTSHTRALPLDQGVIVRPSGLLPSSLHSPRGSKVEGMLAADRARWMMLFRAECRGSLPLLMRQERPCTPEASTGDLHSEQR